MTADRRGVKSQTFDAEKIKAQVTEARTCVAALRSEAITLETLAKELEDEVSAPLTDMGKISARSKALRGGLLDSGRKIARLAPSLFRSFLAAPSFFRAN